MEHESEVQDARYQGGGVSGYAVILNTAWLLLR